MAYETITRYNSPNYTPNSRVQASFGFPRNIIGITIHWWGDPATNPSFDGVVSWLCQARSQVSCHPVVSAGKSAWLVNAIDAAWHSGNAKGNAQTIGIEADPRCRDADYATLAEQVADIWLAYGKLPLYPHKYWKSTACPGNYNLDRIRQEAEVWYAKKTTPQPPADNRPEWQKNLKKWPATKTFWAIDGTTPLRDLTKPSTVVENYAKGTPFEIGGETKINGIVYYITKYSIDKNIGRGFDVYELQETDPNAVVQPEWVRNLKDITDVKLTVLKAEGTAVINLANLVPLESSLIPRGTQVDIAKETMVAGKKYYLTKYSSDRGLANGVLAADLGVPAEPPVNEKPEWLKNLQDIADVDMYARSTTPILKIEDGTVVREVPVNTKVRITHSTTVLDKPLLVLEGQKECIEVVYLSDKPIENPDSDIEERVSALEALVKKIIDFLSGIFTNFKK